ncbi:MAG: hypothetical protein FD180_1518 [Planctomycetota bacterium]|nr:MAG: hypothetical protein FD180_1518 [Planctomycetota bacterium]
MTHLKSSILAASFVAVLAGISLFPSPGAVAGDPVSADDTEIRTVVGSHFQGVIKGDAALLEKAWDVGSGHLKYISKDDAGKESVTVDSAADAIQRWTKSGSPGSEGKVVSVAVHGDRMAVVAIEFTWKNGSETRNLNEFLTLFKLNGAWKIVNKTYVGKSRPARKDGGY